MEIEEDKPIEEIKQVLEGFEENTICENTSKLLIGCKKVTRVDPVLYQASIPEILPKIKQNEDQKEMLNICRTKGFSEVFLHEKLDRNEIENYLQLVKVIFEETPKNTSCGLIAMAGQNYEETALGFLHKMDYSIIRAKFFLFFPSLLYLCDENWNNLGLSETEMEQKIEQYMGVLRESKVNQHEKWKKELDEMLQGKVHIGQLSAHLEQGRNFKYEIPDYIREHFEKASKMSKEIRKMLGEKTNLEDMKNLNKEAESCNIVTKEILLLQDEIEKSHAWLQKVEELKTGRSIWFRTLQNYFSEYKALPILDIEFEEKFKNIYDEGNVIVETILNVNKISKTRSNNNSGKYSLSAGIEIIRKIEQLQIEAEEFETFIKVVEKTCEFQENCQMFFEDERSEKNYKHLQYLISESNSFPFLTIIHSQLQTTHDYFQILEKIKKNLRSKNKIYEIKNDIVDAKERGIFSEELLQLEKKIEEIIFWYEKYELIFGEKEKLPLNDFFLKKTEKNVLPKGFPFQFTEDVII